MDDLVVTAVRGGCGRGACVVVVAADGRPNLVAGHGRSYNRGMLSQETLDAYRRMTPGQRLELTFELIRENVPYLLVGEPELVRRRFELLERENTLRDERIVAALASLPRCPVPAHD